MRAISCVFAMSGLLAGAGPGLAGAAQPDWLLDFATCRDQPPTEDAAGAAAMAALKRDWETRLVASGDQWAPRQPIILLGAPLRLVSPSHGMQPGFTLLLGAPLAVVRPALEAHMGRAFTGCNRDGCAADAGQDPYRASGKHRQLLVYAMNEGGVESTIVACAGEYVP